MINVNMDKVEEMLAGIDNEEVTEVKEEKVVEVKEEKTKALKLTNAEALRLILAIEEVQANSELKEKLEKMLEQTNKKNSVGKSGKVNEENEEIKNQILNTLSDTPMSIKEMQLANEKISPVSYSNQKISALVKNLIAENKVIRVEEKRIAKFKLA